MDGVLGFLGHLRSRRALEDSVFAGWDSGWYHNSAAAAVDGSGVLAAVEEERLSRIKHTGVFPREAIRYCLSQIRGKPDLIAFGEAGGFGELRDPSINPETVRQLLAEECDFDASSTQIALVEHHDGHAYSAASASGFDDALVVTLDGFGDGISGSFREMSAGKLLPVHRTVPFSDSLGRFYSSTLSYLGYRDGDEYKVMGLAPYGDRDRFAGFVERFYSLGPDGGFGVHEHDEESMFHRLRQLGPERAPGGEFVQHHKDVAAAFQHALEMIVLHVLRHEVSAAGARRLCLAGGVAHNSSMIGVLQRELRLDDVFVQPAADDAGIALGAAYAGLEQLGVRAGRPPRTAFFGPGIEPSDAMVRVRAWADWIDAETTRDPVGACARLLASDAVVGVARGRMEFGPRALGHRSVLADPGPAGNRDRVNRIVKTRESFRPFAPAVPTEAAAEYFDLELPADSYRFMTAVTRVRAPYRAELAAVTHVDGSARLQTVSEADDPFFHSLLTSFGRLTGMPVLLNTSMNNHREPIVATPEDAIVFLLTTGIDCVVLGDGLILRRTRRMPIERLLQRARFTLRPGTLVSAVDPPDGVRKYVATGSGRREIRISRTAFDFLNAGAAPDGSEGQGAGALHEIFQLWAERLISVVPDSVP